MTNPLTGTLKHSPGLATSSTALQKRIDNAVLVGVPLAGTFLVPFWVAKHGISRTDAVLFITGYLLLGVGVGLGLHRFFSHRSFRTKLWFAYLLGALGSMSCQGPIFRWVADHRRHHALTDHCGDLHSPLVDSECRAIRGLSGLWHAHAGWLFDASVTDYERYGHGLMDDKVIAFFTRTHWFWPLASLLLPGGIGFISGGLQSAIGALIIGGCLRTFCLHHTIWAVNSLGHTFGQQDYDTGDGSRNNFVLAILTLGEGWHNNHHRFPRSAFHGLRAREIDINGAILCLLEKGGIVWDVVRIPADRLTR